MLLGKPQKHSSKWTAGTCIGTDYSTLNPGDIVGWPVQAGEESGHVAVYIGEPNMMFIDVPGKNKTVRALKRGYGDEDLYKMSY
jgi:cell wall-associated NlpC family hydrolase